MAGGESLGEVGTEGGGRFRHGPGRRHAGATRGQVGGDGDVTDIDRLLGHGVQDVATTSLGDGETHEAGEVLDVDGCPGRASELSAT